ncbi:MAG: ABC transporter ATP-binding protein [Rhizobiaceae bacterium]|nr:ABC transporter ATP-binding protein [Rhizobiaceae bacterium]
MIKLTGSLKTGNNTWLFKDAELELVAGGWTCLLGSSGVGKTTILRLFAGLDTHGTFTDELKTRNCSYMAQQDLLMPWLDVLGNVLLGAKLRGETPDIKRGHQLIERVGLSDHASKYPRQLSGGMRQRAALARTLMEDQDLVLLDEPFSALDAKKRADMQELAHELLSGKTVMLVTHDPAEAARLGDKNAVMDTTGIHEMPAKKGASILAPEASETLKLQAGLLVKLRKDAA